MPLLSEVKLEMTALRKAAGKALNPSVGRAHVLGLRFPGSGDSLSATHSISLWLVAPSQHASCHLTGGQ